MKIVTAAEMREIDRVTSQRYGVPSLTLMENAGRAVADFALSFYPAAQSFGVICGKGNNGGDGFVVARKLHEAGKGVCVLLLADPKELRGDAAENFRSLGGETPGPPLSSSGSSKSAEGEPSSRIRVGCGMEADEAESVFGSDILIDAILGTGFRPPVSGTYAEAIAKMNASERPIVAVDIPSGADADSFAVQAGLIARADAVVTFTAPRPAHIFGNLTSGPTVIAPIGSPDEAIQSSLRLNLIAAKDIAHFFAPRPRDSNKGMYGHVLVVGGSLGKAGAAAMAGFSALRVGAGLVTVATGKSVLPTVAGFHPELMTEPLDETGEGAISARAFQSLEKLAKKKNVLAIGPGISRNEETAEVVRRIIAKVGVHAVLDADGLNAFQDHANELSSSSRDGAGNVLVLTPHPGEMSRLTGMSIKEIQRDRLNVARDFAKRHAVILVLKGDRTIVAGPDGQAWVNPTGNPGMATGGTGDILTGIVAGLMAQFADRAFEAVVAAVYLHGLAGDVARDEVGEQPLVATDLIRCLPDAIRHIRAQAASASVEVRL
jgi:NAD(P)H-hydrate epimerase